jgi:GNAT superfamily N-acetyltransferase
MRDVVIRPGTLDDAYATFHVFEETLHDLIQRLGETNVEPWDEPDKLARMWAERRSLFEYLAGASDRFWVAEQDDRVLGFARSIVRDGVRELTEFFIRPAGQSAGVGRELLARAFPANDAERRFLIATIDTRAQVRYLKSGLYPQFPICYFGKTPEVASVETDLDFRPFTAAPEHLAALDDLDRAVIGYRRSEEHRWLLTDRSGFLYLRQGRPVGYGYSGKRNGPFALLDAQDFPAVLAHAEANAVGRWEHFGVEVPMINRVAVDYLLERGFRMDSFVALFMCDEPFGRWENYILTSPPLFV